MWRRFDQVQSGSSRFNQTQGQQPVDVAFRGRHGFGRRPIGARAAVTRGRFRGDRVSTQCRSGIDAGTMSTSVIVSGSGKRWGDTWREHVFGKPGIQGSASVRAISAGAAGPGFEGEMEELLSRRFQVGKHGRFVEPDDLATPQSPDERKQFVFRRCLCGCGESRLCRADAPDGNAQPVSTQWRTSLAETGGSKPVRPSAQRAICERLTRKPPPRLSAATVETLEKQTTPSSESHPGPLRQVGW